MTKEILVISFFYQPYNTIGAVRVANFVKYLQKKGYKVHVVTAKRSIDLNLNIAKPINTYYIWWLNADKLIALSRKYPKLFFLKQVARILNHLSIITTGHLPEGGVAIWRYFAYNKAKSLIKQNNINLIYSSSGPVSSTIIGSKLAKRYKILWIPEFRDLWSNNVYTNLKGYKKRRNIKVELKMLKNASHIITCTGKLQDQLIKIHKIPTSIIYNGYDYLNKDEVLFKNKKLFISHFGSLYNGKRDPKILFKALRELIDAKIISHNNIEINFFAGNIDFMNKLVDEFELSTIVNLYAKVSRSESLEYQKKSNILLLLSWNDKRDQALPAKMYEYIGMKRPILASCYPGEIKDILSQTKTGVVINNVDEMKCFLINAIENYKKNPNINFIFDEDEIKKYSRDYQNTKLVKIIESFL